MKKILYVLGTAMALMACSQQEEPIKLVTPERSEVSAELINYKNQRANRNIVVAMHYDWGTKPGYSLANTPDSLDMIVLKNNYAELSNEQRADLKAVQVNKGTLVLPSIDMEVIAQTVQKRIANDYKAAKKVQDATWAKAGTRPSDEATITQTYQAIKEAILREEQHKLSTWVDEQGKAIERYLGADFGFDGISLRLPQGTDVFTNEQTTMLLDKALSLAGKDKAKTLVIESPLVAYKEHLMGASYLILHQPELTDFKEYEILVNNFADSRLLFAYDLNDANLSKGYKNIPFFTSSDNLDKSQILLQYKHTAKAGIAVYHSEKYYFEVESYQGFVNPYVPLKALINRVAQPKN